MQRPGDGVGTGPASVILASLLVLTASCGYAATKNGFDLSSSSIDPDLIEQGGPPRDGIPAIDNPAFVAADKAGFLSPADRILGLAIGKTARAYPVKILNWHEIVNDSIDSKPVAVTYCPLCGTGIAFNGNVRGSDLEFGVSGLLYNSDVLLYDRQTESPWRYRRGRGISHDPPWRCAVRPPFGRRHVADERRPSSPGRGRTAPTAAAPAPR